MPNIPVTWLEEFNVTLTSNPQDPDIIQLANGNILVSWSTTDDTAPGDTAGEDIVGQIFDPLGNAVGGPIRLNQNFFVDGENNSDLAALPNGGFLMVYQDNEGAFGTSLRLEQYNATGGSTSSVTIQSDAAAGALLQSAARRRIERHLRPGRLSAGYRHGPDDRRQDL